MLAGIVFIPAVHAVQLRLKYTKDQTLVNDVVSSLKGDVKIDGAQRLEGTAEGSFGVKMNQKTLDVDEAGAANIEYRLDSLNITMNSEADMGEGKKKYSAKLTESGGSYTVDGQEVQIPPMDDVKAQSWQVKMNNLGSPVSFSLDSSQLGAEEAKEVQNRHTMPSTDPSFKLVWLSCTRPNGVSTTGRACPAAGASAGNRTAKLWFWDVISTFLVRKSITG